MNFLFSKTVMAKQGKCIYKLYEFKLAPGHYHAELVSHRSSRSITQMNFKKENGRWLTSSRSKEAKMLAEILGTAIDRSRN